MENRSLLLIEDDIELSEILQRRFERRGHRVVTCEMPEQALQSATTQDFDVVIVDGLLRGRDGVDLVQALKHKRPSLPCIMLSGNSSELAIARALNAGVSRYLLKPCSLVDLESAINQVAEASLT